ncbi:MAG: dihydrofolate reductase family protein [Ferruginibacter sp.]
MRELILIAQTSLDGFVAGIHGEFDNFIGGEENLEFVCNIIDEADAILLGRISYQLLNSDWPTAANKPGATKNMIKYSNWYNAASKTVVSKTLVQKDINNAAVVNEDLLPAINELKQQAGKNILIFGSPTLVHSLLELNLLDGFWLIVHPVLFGQGIPLFRSTEKVTKLQLLASKELSNGTFCNKYAVNNP